ncbi:ATP-binding protein [Peterkaempfera bronchialis]|uniref:ATP-binding protein n=2 Tax=Peterkaempfera bronchialis TaxID=2126346 RepID=A0A345SYG0_9ACTN|nr:ATP-binding protein [Peterkaempfera bronchialis]
MGSENASLGSRLVAARDRAFVGRAAELALFRSALSDAAVPVSYLHGPGGIGKSTLLRQFAGEARQAGRTVVEVDGRTVNPTPEDFAQAAADALRDPRAVLLIDTFERCQGLEGWLWERFLPRLPLGAVAVVAGRVAPDPRWVADSGWTGQLQVIALRNLPPGDATAFLRARGVPTRAHNRLLSFTGGNPLALALAAAVAVRGGGEEREWSPDQDVIATLLPQLVGDPPTPLHRKALEVCAHAYVTSEALMRAMVGERAASELFGWLRTQPFIESTASGLFPHDVVREALDADLRWRDPEGFAAMHKQMHQYLFERVRAAPAARMLQAVGEMLYMYRTDGHMPEFHVWDALGIVQDTPCAPADVTRVAELVEEAEGAESAAIVRFWLDRQPEAFRVYRSTRTGRIEAFTAVLWLSERDGPVGEDVDPVLAAAWAHVRRYGPLRSGERLAVARFTVHPPLYQRPSAPTTLAQWRMMGEIYRAERLSWHFVVMRDDGFWDAHLMHFDMLPTHIRPEVGDHRYILYGHDWRAEPVIEWLAAKTDSMLAGGGPDSDGAAAASAAAASASAAKRTRRGELVVLSRPEFDAAVRDALRTLRHQELLARNPLQRSRVVVESGRSLGDVLLGAIDALLDERDGGRRHRAITATYVKPTSTQEAAAARLGLPFSTYRRHLKTAVERVSDLLWHQELSGAAILIGPE